MATSIEIPDELYRKLEAKTTVMGRRVREVTMELYEHWLADENVTSIHQPPSNAEGWLEAWFSAADEAMAKVPGSPTAREILQEDRNRPERQ
ncbi:MAG: hypothetical protein NTW21_40375 [Verrucomicrobia bacterium]|nr:hypothetical protein [Verrucomicrobiota bacterium]